MADAKKCDRCGNFYLEEEKGNEKTYFLYYENPYTHNSHPIDLCNSCEKDFVDKFMNPRNYIFAHITVPDYEYLFEADNKCIFAVDNGESDKSLKEEE